MTNNLDHAPGLAPGNRTALRNPHHVALTALVVLVVHEKFRAATKILAIQRMTHHAGDLDAGALVHAGADHARRDPALRAGLLAVLWHRLVHPCSPARVRSPMRVITRAMSRLTRFISLGRPSWPVPCCMRSLNAS